MLTEKIKTSMATACDVVLESVDAVLDCVQVRAIETPHGRRWRVAVIYDFFEDNDVISNSHGLPLFANKKTANEVAAEVAKHISANLGGLRVPVYSASGYDGTDD